MAHVGQKQRLGTGGRFRLVTCDLKIGLSSGAHGQIILDGLGHRVHGLAQRLDLVQGAAEHLGANLIVAGGKGTRLVAEGLDGTQHAPPNHHQRKQHDGHQTQVNRHGQDNEALHFGRGLTDGRLGPGIDQARQIRHGPDQFSAIVLVLATVNQLGGICQVGFTF